MNNHYQKQIEIINQLEEQIQTDSLHISMVTPVEDFDDDDRTCLTSVHLPHTEFLNTLQNSIIAPLKKVDPSPYYYSNDSLHMTIKNIRVIDTPPRFTQADIEKAEQVFDTVLPRHKKFNVYFYRLLLFPNNLALIGTTDEERDKMFLDLDEQLTATGIPDDKFYTNKKYFFMNMTLARFTSVSEEFTQIITKLSQSLILAPYTIDSVTLLTANAVLKKRTSINTWQLP